MKLVRFGADGEARVGMAEGDRVLELRERDLMAVLRDRGVAADVTAEHGLDEVTLGPPIPRPGKIVCVGLNYRDHAQETGQPLPEVPLLFAKFPNSITGPESVIEVPSMTKALDWEAELAVVIGVNARDLPASSALTAVAGYMNMNDVSARDVQIGEGGQWTRGKSFDTFAPTGPYLVTAEEIEDPQDLAVACWVNGETVQSGTTADMIFPVAELIAFISQSLTLEPGDIIATGTPAGVGMARAPQLFLDEGDEVVVEVEGLGRLVNHVTAKK
jgi:2,4-diketo-3-deoxy-L-fuconate hydrolase